MALPIVVSMPGCQLGYLGAMDAHVYPRDDLPMEVEPFWDPNVLDPGLRDVDNVSAYYPDWSPSAQPWTRFSTEPAHLMSSFQMQAQAGQKMYNRPYEATGPIPRPYEPVRGSPTSSSCSSITSPGMDQEWFGDSYQPQQPMMEDYALSRSASESQAPPDLCWDAKPLPLAMPLAGLVNLSNVQGIPDLEVQDIPNPQEVAFHRDQYEMDVDPRIEYPVDAEGRTVGTKATREHYGHTSEDAVALSPNGVATAEVNHGRPVTMEDAEGDVDAEGEDVDEFDENMHETEEAVEEEEDRDTDYKPKAPRAKRRRTSRAASSSSSRGKQKVKKVSRKSQFQCKTCDHLAKDTANLTRHVTTFHTRPYVCTFSFAGCRSTFGNKNEWKRHVSSQHLGLQHWVCSEGSCPPSKSNVVIKETSSARAKLAMNVFNRKDLFTQHLKRMHAPTNVRDGKKNLAWEERVKELQSSCLVIRRDPPSKTKCPVRQCGQVFEGVTSWDERMEHVGRHLEKGSGSGHGDVANDDLEQESDEFMIQWAIRERIIDRHGSGYRFCKYSGSPAADSDAEAEEE